MKEIEVQAINELEPGKLYHINLTGEVDTNLIEQFTAGLRKQGVKALITHGEIKFEEFSHIFENLSEEQKEFILKCLKPKMKIEINPLDFEPQTK